MASETGQHTHADTFVGKICDESASGTVATGTTDARTLESRTVKKLAHTIWGCNRSEVTDGL